MAAVTSCYVCPKHAALYYNLTDRDRAYPNEAGTDCEDWCKLPQLQSWTLEATVTDPDEFVTSSTNGVAVTACPGTVSYSLTTNFKLCESDWLYAHLLEEPITDVMDDNYIGGFQSAGNVIDAFWYATWRAVAPTCDPSDAGIYFRGQPTPGGFGLDNNSTTAAETEPTINISLGPFFPEANSYENCTRPLNWEEEPPV